MLPHPQGEPQAIVAAFHNCSLGLKDLDRDELDEDVQRLLAKLDWLMDTAGLEDPSGRGLGLIRAEQLTLDQKLDLSRIVDELASWFNMKFWQQA